MSTPTIAPCLPDAEELFTDALRGHACEVLGLAPDPIALPMRTWAGAVSPSDRAVLAHCRGATLDIGCGPGRMSAHLAGSGHQVIGIDVLAEAVAQTRDRGVAARRADVFGAVPRAGLWDTALLADGNIGIGGDPVRLLRRVRSLVTGVDGRIVADLAPYGTGLRQHEIRLRRGTRVSAALPWAVVGADAVGAAADEAGLVVLERHEYAGRWCAVLGVTA